MREMPPFSRQRDPPRNEDPSLLDSYYIPNPLRIFLHQVLDINPLLSFTRE